MPFWWRLIDCSFGIIGLFPLMICLKNIKRLEVEEKRKVRKKRGVRSAHRLKIAGANTNYMKMFVHTLNTWLLANLFHPAIFIIYFLLQNDAEGDSWGFAFFFIAVFSFSLRSHLYLSHGFYTM
jgi:Na+/melibiose symporter-like transporter